MKVFDLFTNQNKDMELIKHIRVRYYKYISGDNPMYTFTNLQKIHTNQVCVEGA